MKGGCETSEALAVRDRVCGSRDIGPSKENQLRQDRNAIANETS